MLLGSNKTTLVEGASQYIKENLIQIITLLFFTVLAYGYFLANWSISIDGENNSFPSPEVNTAILHQGRFFAYLCNLFSNNHIVPFWNDFISITLIFLSSLIWTVNLSIIKKEKLGTFIFSLIYVISPIYVFYLKFTLCNVCVSVGLLLTSLAAYYFRCFLDSLAQGKGKKLYFSLSVVLMFIAIGIYETFTVSWVSSVLLITAFKASANKENNSQPYFKLWITQSLWGATILVFALFLYKIVFMIVYYFLPFDNYTSVYMRWGHESLTVISRGLIAYFKKILLQYSFDFFITFTLLSTFIFFLYLLIKSRRNIAFILILSAFFFSAFLLPLMMGNEMPLRTILSLPLVLGGLWLIIYTTFESLPIKRAIHVVILITTLFNAHFITRMFYGDNMRLQYDINYANLLYTFVLANTGDALKTKPLAIVGTHSHPEKPFIIKPSSDTLGYSFFEWDQGNISRMNMFMKWLGDDYIRPTGEQQAIANTLSFNMPTFPNKGSIKETKDLIVLKISPPRNYVEYDPITLDAAKYKSINPQYINATLDELRDVNNQLSFAGWSYFRNKDALDTNIFIKMASKKEKYIFPVVNIIRPDVAQVFKDGKNMESSGFYRKIDKTKLKDGEYKISLLLTNKQDISEVFIKTIKIQEKPVNG